MTNEERKVLELALDWIEKQPEETPDSKYDLDTRYVVLRELEAALAQPEQEPVAWEQFYPDIGKPQIEFAPVKIVAYNCTCGRTMNFESDHGVVAPQRKWVGLSDEDISEIVRGTHNTGSFVRAIEAKLKEKNNGIKE
jgi:hypothetical protein